MANGPSPSTPSTRGAASPGAGFPQWTVSSENNQVAEVTNATEKAMAEAAVWPYTLTFFASEAAADAYAKSQGGGPDTSKSPLQTGVNALSGSVPNPLAFLGNIANFFGDFTQANTWIRVAKVVIGGVLLIVGASHITNAPAAIKKVASKVPVIP